MIDIIFYAAYALLAVLVASIVAFGFAYIKFVWLPEWRFNAMVAEDEGNEHARLVSR